jgi:hypothetical protein
MKKTVRSSVSGFAIAAVLTSGLVGLDAASAKGKSDKIEAPTPRADDKKAKLSVGKGKSNWIFPTVAAVAVAVGIIAVSSGGKSSSP